MSNPKIDSDKIRAAAEAQRKARIARAIKAVAAARKAQA
jgi:hypothetical protein